MPNAIDARILSCCIHLADGSQTLTGASNSRGEMGSIKGSLVVRTQPAFVFLSTVLVAYHVHRRCPPPPSFFRPQVSPLHRRSTAADAWPAEVLALAATAAKLARLHGHRSDLIDVGIAARR